MGLLLLPYVLVGQHAQAKRIGLYPVDLPAHIHRPKISVTVPIPRPTMLKSRPSKATIYMPLETYRITSAFGWRRHPVTGRSDFHNGIDLAARSGVVCSIMAGTVEATGYHRNLGNYVCIDHGNVQSIYGHLSRITVGAGQTFEAGYPIGITGSTGRTTGEHLHFSIRRNGVYIDPWKFLYRILQHIENEQ